jgi:hypothetical protein
LRERLDAIEQRLDSFKASVQDLPGQVDHALRERLEGNRAKVRAQKARVDKTSAMLKTRAQRWLTETDAVVSEWKANREAEKLSVRAIRAEAYAADALDFAVATIDEADAAILGALVARIDADTIEEPRVGGFDAERACDNVAAKS